jgi:hypothetical protein
MDTISEVNVGMVWICSSVHENKFRRIVVEYLGARQGPETHGKHYERRHFEDLKSSLIN